ncbi:hypothetical protein [Sorangium sp. So ce204]|uniref:hypothetical protein n=1 Tax=Sorangium sp. So ce204 TaxID=3133288 RepID=UPI003F639F56
MSQTLPPNRRRGTQDVSRSKLEPSERGQRGRLDPALEALLSSRAVPNHVASGPGNMTGTVAHGEPAASTASGLMPATISPAADPFAQRRDEVRAVLLASAPRPSAAETLLYDVASRELAIYVALSEAQEQLARELREAVSSDVRGVLAISKVLREVTQVTGAIERRVEHVLTTATSLRAQRRFLELQGGRDET